jgi:hypothetical protein
MVDNASLTPIQIAVLALAHEEYESKGGTVAVWGSWQRAAKELGELLVSIGTTPGTRELEWKTLHGRHRRGRAGRPVHLYTLSNSDDAVQLAERCARAVQHLPKWRLHATWKDVEAETLSLQWGPEAHRCSACGCKPGLPCTIVLPNGCGEASCVPAGVFHEFCSACW